MKKTDTVIPSWEVQSSNSEARGERRAEVDNEQITSPIGSSLPFWC